MTTMTPAELRAHCVQLGLDQEDLAKHLGVTGRTMRRWIAGTHAIPEGVATEVARLAHHTTEHVHSLAEEIAESEPDEHGQRWAIACRTEAKYLEGTPHAQFPSSWHPPLTFRAAEMAGARVRFEEDDPPKTAT